jgi:hypothetical protein
MADRAIKPRTPGAQMARKATPQPQPAPMNARRTERSILPSRRVVEFLFPNVGEFIELRERAAIKASKDSAGDKMSHAEFGLQLGMMGLRKLLIRMTHAPVPPVFKPGMSETTARTSALATVAEAVRQRAELAASGERDENEERYVAFTSDEIAAMEIEAVDDAIYEAEDVEATKAAANLHPVTDWDWDEGPSYIRSIPNAEFGTTEAADWLAIHDIAGRVMSRVTMAALRGGAVNGGPKAGSKIRPWR